MTGPVESVETPWTETRLAESVVKECGADIRFCAPWKKWLVYDGTRWRLDDSGHVARKVKQRIRDLHLWAVKKDYELIAKFFARSEKRSVREAVQALAAVEEPVQVAPGDFDADPWLLNVRNGTVDLRTGKLRPHRREDYCTKLAPVVYDANAKAPTWVVFLERIFSRNADLFGFVQRAAGYSLTGDVGEQCLFIAHGAGANGKSTMLEVLRAAMGDYARAAPADLFVASKGDRHPTEVASLLGVRFAPCVETREGARLNEVLLKQLTGGDTVTARRMREDFWEFSPVAKLWLGTNHRPAIRGTDEAIWRRVRLIPFTVTIPEQERDKKLPTKLRAELPGILAWAVRGCLAWQRDGLSPPAEVTGATADYRQAEDRLGLWIAERCLIGSNRQATAADLYADFCRWAEEHRESAPSAKTFGESLADRGFERDRAGKDRSKIWRGIGLLEERRTDADSSSGLPLSRARAEVNRISGPHRSAEREPGSDDGEDGLFEAAGGAPCGR
ncbi:MAG: DNA primase family protein [Myxococcales bacterium]